MKRFRKFHTDEACADNNCISNLAFPYLSVYCLYIPGEPEAVDTCRIRIWQRQLHRCGTGPQYQYIIRQYLFLASCQLCITNHLSCTVNRSHITAGTGINPLVIFKIFCIARNSLRRMIEFCKVLYVPANKIRKTASAIAKLRTSFQYDNFRIFITSA